MPFTLHVPERPQSLVRKLMKRLSVNKASEVAQLKPVALAGASNQFRGPSQLCSAFAAKQCSPPAAELSPKSEEDAECQYILMAGEPDAPRHTGSNSSRGQQQTRVCRMCAHSFLPSHASAQRYPNFCSLDCKSAFLLGVDTYGRAEDESESESSAVPIESRRR